MLAVALSTEILNIGVVDNFDVNYYSEVNRLFVEQFNQLATMDMTRGGQQRQLVLFDAVCRNSTDLHNPQSVP